MQAVGRHIPFGFLQRTDVLVHWEVEVTVLVEVVVFHLLRVEVNIGEGVRTSRFAVMPTSSAVLHLDSLAQLCHLHGPCGLCT